MNGIHSKTAIPHEPTSTRPLAVQVCEFRAGEYRPLLVASLTRDELLFASAVCKQTQQMIDRRIQAVSRDAASKWWNAMGPVARVAAMRLARELLGGGTDVCVSILDAFEVFERPSISFRPQSSR
jgi:hypothetical protein